ncbi:protein-disulfide reductase DsbD [Marinobacter zhejiangensis]|uniref:Thiol:disulfide interchange protein DsbD n=1 Tax=Marinobacter zhejiangensis TaxID=488535 RepID=A0A1I4SI39_9GAMM|nr:protein-disulfide reductase DsbD [Marinobacter zhejiangensis]SFM64146.1 thiol:disulfide interchange protein DsbD [Marinobacter zhejiangensis]
MAVLLFVVLIGLPGLVAAEEPVFLPVDEAFSPSVSYDGEVLAIEWAIAPGYYLYESRISVVVAGDAVVDGAFVTEPEIKQDPWFGEQAVFHDVAGWQGPLSLDGVSEVTYRYQGCAEAGLCYPPQTRTTQVPVPAPVSVSGNSVKAAAVPVPAVSSVVAAGAETSEAEGLASLLNEAGLAMILGTFFLLGLGLTFTPCVLPMVPILSSIIVGQNQPSSAARGFSLSVAYVLGMAATYTALGITVGYLGARANLQAAMQQPWVIVIFVALFVLLALAMFGLYELQLPAALRDRLDRLGQKSKGGQWLGVALMGLISALVVSPCVSAPLAGALLYISTTGDAVIGGGALFAMALGMGVPLIAIGTTGARILPRAGMWMERVKQLFGVGLLVVALGLLDRILPNTAMLVLWGALLLWCGIQVGALEANAAGWAGSRKTLGVLLSVWGLLLVLGAARGDGSLWQPLAGFGVADATEVGGAPAPELFEVIDDVGVLNGVLNSSLNSGQPVMVDVYADWCISCKVMEEEVFDTPDVRAWAQRVRFVKLDVTAFSAAQKDRLEQWQVPGPPAVLFFGGERDSRELPTQRLLGESSLGAVVGGLARLGS